MHPSRFDPAGPSPKPYGPKESPNSSKANNPEPYKPFNTTHTKVSRKLSFASPIGAKNPLSDSDRSRSSHGAADSSGERQDASPASSVATSASTTLYDPNGVAPGVPRQEVLPVLPTITESSPAAAATRPDPMATVSQVQALGSPGLPNGLMGENRRRRGPRPLASLRKPTRA